MKLLCNRSFGTHPSRPTSLSLQKSHIQQTWRVGLFLCWPLQHSRRYQVSPHFGYIPYNYSTFSLEISRTILVIVDLQGVCHTSVFNCFSIKYWYNMFSCNCNYLCFFFRISKSIDLNSCLLVSYKCQNMYTAEHK